MKTLILIIFIAINSFGLKAQYPKGQSPEHQAQGKVNLLKGMLNLTSQQTSKVMQIYIHHYRSTDSLKTIIIKKGPNPNTINSNLLSMLNAKKVETDKKINSVLNNNQKQIYLKFVNSQSPAKIVTLATPVPKR